MMIKTYNQLCRLHTFEERFEYLKVSGIVGQSTFGFDRYLNQVLYHSGEWKRVRNLVIIRDESCDLGIPDREIFKDLMVHHIVPITMENIVHRDRCVFDLNNLITTSYNTHQAIHYGDESHLLTLPKERRKGDTLLW